MKKKNGFTLVELIAVIAILVVILVMFVPSLLNSINENKTKALNKIYDLIETAARNYVMDYNISTPTKIELEDLCNTTYIECPIINPETEEELNGYIFVGEDYYYSEVIETNVTVELNGGDTSQTFENSYEPGTVIDLITPTKGEEEFSGWKVVKGNSGIRDNKLVVGTTESIIWAEWKTKELVKLTVDLDGGSLSNKLETAYLPGTTITLDSPTKEGYIFDKWNISGTGASVNGNTLIIGTENTIVTAVWKEEQATALSFADDDWSTIVRAVQSGNHLYEVGNTKTVDMGSLGVHTLRVANTTKCSEVEVESKTACGFVLEFADIIKNAKMNDTDTNAGGWPTSKMRNYVNTTIYNALPEEIRNGIIDTYVVSSHGSGETTGELENDNFGSTDKLYLLSTEEVWAQGSSNTIGIDTSRGTSRQLDYYEDYQGNGYTGVSTTNYAGAIKNDSSGSASWWWLRSARSDISYAFFGVSTSGDWSYGYANASVGLAPAFRLAE